MDDRQIIDLLTDRKEDGLHALTAQYGGACRQIAAQILGNEEDAQEMWNDTLMHIWNAIPPAKPDNLFAYLCTTVRRLSYTRLKQQRAQKRGGGTVGAAVSLEAMPERLHPAQSEVEEAIDAVLMKEAVDRFLSQLSEDAMTIFVQRYGNGKTIAEIAKIYQISQNKTALSLMRTRIKLKKYLREEGLL